MPVTSGVPFNMSRTSSRGNNRPGLTSRARPGLFIYRRPACRPLSHVSVRRSSRCLISARGACAPCVSQLRLGPRHLSLSTCVPPLAARRKGSGSGSQRPRTWEGRVSNVSCPARGGYAADPTMRPTTQHQHASSRATAMFATTGLLPASSSVLRLSTSLRLPLSARLLTAGSTSCPRAGGLARREALAKCHAASTRSLPRCLFPALVIPPLLRRPPPGLSEVKRAHVGSPALEPSKTVPVREASLAPHERHLHLRRPDGSRPSLQGDEPHLGHAGSDLKSSAAPANVPKPSEVYRFFGHPMER